MYNGNEFNNKKGSVGLILIQVWANVYVYFNTFKDLIDLRTTKQKTADLANIVKNEVYESMRRVYNAQKYYVIMTCDTMSPTMVLQGFAKLQSDQKIIAIFSSAGVKLPFKEVTQNDVNTFSDITASDKLNYAFIYVTSTASFRKKLFTNFDYVSLPEVAGCDFLIELTRNIDTYANFLKTQAQGGFGNDSGTSPSIIDTYITGL